RIDWLAPAGVFAFCLLASAPAAQREDAPARRASAGIELAQLNPKRVLAPKRAAAANSEQANRERLNAWTLGLAAGRTEGAPLQLASELARVLDDGDNLRIVPMVTRGPLDNAYDLLYLHGVSAASGHRYV